MADTNEHKQEIKEESFMEKLADKLHFTHHDEKHDAPKVNEPEKKQVQEKVEEKIEEKVEEKEKEKEKEKVIEKEYSSSSSDSESEKEVKSEKVKEEESSSVQTKVNRLFGREKPVHQVLGGGKSADVFLWRDKKVSAGVLGTATLIWIVFELLEYHLLALICHIGIFTLATVFLWSNASTFINKSPPHIPDISVPERPLLELASAVRTEINCGLALLRDIASGRELKKFLAVIAGLWLLSIVGSRCNFLTLFYIIFVVLHTLPALYEKHEDKVDTFAERAAVEAKKHYSVVNERYLSKIPNVPLKMKKDT